MERNLRLGVERFHGFGDENDHSRNSCNYEIKIYWIWGTRKSFYFVYQRMNIFNLMCIGNLEIMYGHVCV